jgi:hypothetical protein
MEVVMTEDQALDKAAVLLKQTGTVKSGRAILKLKRHMSGEQFGYIWEAFVASSPIEVVIEID